MFANVALSQRPFHGFPIVLLTFGSKGKRRKATVSLSSQSLKGPNSVARFLFHYQIERKLYEILTTNKYIYQLKDEKYYFGNDALFMSLERPFVNWFRNLFHQKEEKIYLKAFSESTSESLKG